METTGRPSRIVLQMGPNARYEEYPCDSANGVVLPGMALQVQSDGGVVPQAIAGGTGLIIVAIESVLVGGTIFTAYNQNDIVFTVLPSAGDMFQALIPIGQNITRGAQLQFNGDGTFIVAAAPGGATLYEITAVSTTITNIGTETAFSNGSYGIAANYLRAGDILNIHSKSTCLAENSTNTHRVRLYIGPGPTTLADSTALQLTANDVVIIDCNLTIRDVGATGHFVGEGVVTTSVGGTFTETPFTLASTVIDTTAIQTVVEKSLASATSSGNQIRLDEFAITVNRAGQNAMVTAEEAVNNSAGSGPALIKVRKN